ncbi:MAG: aspartate aminotransferase family protein [Rhodospirillaceae bacterium]|nr:aspartate aminotransferase family protein [Rhodospirillaceae bacterium]|tara:strand:+ start:1828 stop:3111 length:1284 start_codon:yes stop_codon:yes gene_type:complete
MTISFRKSNNLYNKALNTIPLATQTFSKSSLQWPLGASPMFFEKAKGCKIVDVDGNTYIDYLLSLLPIILGYQDKDVDIAVKEQMKKGVVFSMSHPIEIELAEKIKSIIPYAEMVRFGKNGSDVLSAAVRLARAYTKKDIVLVSGYHGWHDWYIGSTSRNMGVPKEVSRLTKTFKYNDINDLVKKIKKFKNKICAIIVEPDGIIIPEKHYLKELKSLCQKSGILLIFDEIVCGFRTHIGGASKKFGIMPDLGCFGKSMANGYPISAIVGRKKIMRNIEEIFVSGTFAGETLSMAAALATIKKLEILNVPQKLEELGSKLIKQTNDIILRLNLQKYIEMEGNNWWPRFTFKNQSNITLHLFRQELIKSGLFIGSSYNLCLKHNNKQIFNSTISRMKKSLEKVKYFLETKEPEKFLEGKKLKGVFNVRK